MIVAACVSVIKMFSTKLVNYQLISETVCLTLLKANNKGKRSAINFFPSFYALLSRNSFIQKAFNRCFVYVFVTAKENI